LGHHALRVTPFEMHQQLDARGDAMPDGGIGKSTPDCSTHDVNRLNACSAEFA
jgi:hypothetical protein